MEKKYDILVASRMEKIWEGKKDKRHCMGPTQVLDQASHIVL